MEEYVDPFEVKLVDWTRKGAEERVSLIESLPRKLLQSQKQKILQGDETIMQDLFLPKWFNWELLQEAAKYYMRKGTF
jgi:hypothetical protein